MFGGWLAPAWARAARAGVAEHDTVRAQSADQLDGQVRQDVGEVGDVVAGVHDDEHVRVARLASAGLPEPRGDVAQLDGGHRGGVVGRSKPDGVQNGGP